jgi:hypothetical protein
MRSCAAIAVLLLYFPHSANASVLKGVVKENELGGSPFANVEISAPGASPTETDQNGQFTLIFPTKKPGETVLVSVSKPATWSLTTFSWNNPCRPTRMPSCW